MAKTSITHTHSDKPGPKTARHAKLARARVLEKKLDAKSKRRSSAQKQHATRMSRAGSSDRARATRMAHGMVAKVKSDIRERKDRADKIKRLSKAAKARKQKDIST